MKRKKMRLVTRAEIVKIIGELHIAYPRFPEPNSFIGDSKQALSAVVDMWYSFFKTDLVEVVQEAVHKHIATSKFPPTIADLKIIISEIMTAENPSPEQIWSEADRLLNSGIPANQEPEAYMIMSPACKAAVEAVGGWYVLSMSPADDSYIKSQFIKAAAEFLVEKRKNSALQGSIAAAACSAIAGEV